MNTLALALIVLPQQGDAKLSVIRPGEIRRGEVTKESPIVRAQKLDPRAAKTPLRGRSFELRIGKEGEYTIELRSHFFDAYLVIRNVRGRTVEDDDGLLRTHARIARRMQPGVYRIDACALHGRVGPFELRARPGLSPALGGPERTAAAVADVRASLVAREKAFGGEHPGVAANLHELAGLLRSLGKYAEAEPLLRRTLTIEEKAFGKEHPEVAVSLSNLADLLSSQGKYDEAEALLRRAVAIDEKTVGAQPRDVAASLNNLAVLLSTQGKNAEAERLHRRALGIQETALGKEHPDVAGSLNNLASLLGSQGKYSEAEPLHRRAVAIESDSGDERSLSSSLNNLARLFYWQGKFAEAEPLCRRALAIREKALGADHPLVAHGLVSLAALLHSQGKDAEGEPLCRRGLAIREKAFGDDHPDVAASLDTLADLLSSQGKHASAERLCRRALAIYEKSFGSEDRNVADSLSSLAGLLFSQGEHTDAEPLLRRAIAIRGKALGKEHPATVSSRDNLLSVLGDTGRLREAEALAHRLCDTAMGRTLREYARAASDERFRLGGEHLILLNRMLSCIPRLEGKEGAADVAWRQVTAWKGLVFRHAVRLGRATNPSVARMRRQLASVVDRMGALRYATKIPDADAHARRFDKLLADSRRLEQELLSELGIVPEREKTNPGEIAALLPRGSAVLDFLLHTPFRFARRENGKVVEKGHWDEPRMLCFVVRHGHPHAVLVDLGAAKTLTGAVDRYLSHIARGARGETLDRNVDPAAELREKLLTPLLPHLGNASLLFVCADGFLAKLPFGALETSKDRFLLQDCNVVHMQDPVTLRDRLTEKRAARAAARTAFAVGGVDYNARAAASEPIKDPDPDSTRGGFERRWRPLPGTKRELDDLVRRLGDDATTRHGAAATEEAILRHAPGKSILHLATHGFFERRGVASLWEAALAATREAKPGGLGRTHDDRRPEFRPPLQGEPPGLLAGLVFAGANATETPENRRDGILTATEVAQLDLSGCDLAVLSACETALGTARSGEGLLSLRRAFREAGAKSVISTLWKVDDQATRKLIDEFYHLYLDKKQSAADALRNARLTLRRSSDYASPRYWGAFVLAGEWR